ncbi:MAG: 5'-nucleotidase C-terminal domain-containing protein [Oscillospiraceae bacterium]|nr:5'-nucleotidase C-terminal domain-containing protein [Oscillospiraceae bacterium]
MMQKKFRLTALLLSLLLCVSLLPGTAFAAEGAAAPYTGDLVLFLANDMHSNLGPSKIYAADGSTSVIGGVARMAAALTEERARAEGKALTLNGGDYSQGTPYQDGYQQGWEIMVLAALGFDYVTLGNHEFDVGDQAIENSWVNARANRAAFGVTNELPTLLVSNMFIKYDASGKEIVYTDADIDPEDADSNAFASGQYAETGAVNYAVTEVNGYQVGLFALEGEESYGYCKNSDLTRMDCPTVANIYARFLKEEKACDIVIAVSHCGDEEDKAVAEASQGYLDVIQSAHSHTVYPEPITVNGVIIYSTGEYAQHLGILSLEKTGSGWKWIPSESQTITLTEKYDRAESDTSASGAAYRELAALVSKYDDALVADDGYFSKLGLEGVTPAAVVMDVEKGYNYYFTSNGDGGYTYVQSPVTAFIGDSFNYASGSQVSFFFGGYVRTALYQGEFTVADAFNMQSTGESAIDHSAGSSLIVCNLSGKQLAGICLFDAMCSHANGEDLYGGAGTLHSSNMRYRYDVSGKTISCDLSTIEIYDPETNTWSPLDPDKAYLSSFTFESTQNLVGFMPTLTKTLGYGEIPFAPYDENTGTYANVPADNTSDAYYAFWAPYCKGVGVLEGTEYELKAWTALYYYAKTMDGTLSDAYTIDGLTQTRLRGEYTVDGKTTPGASVQLLSGSAPAASAKAGTDGSYTLKVPNGTYTLTVDGQALDEVTVSRNTVTAQAADYKVLINGEDANVAVYTINGAPYLKLRDVAAAVSGSPAKFDLGWDHTEKAIAITSGKAYTPAGGEGEAVSGTEKLVNPSAASVLLDGEDTAFTLYVIRGNNYCSLASLSALGLQASWDAGNGTVSITAA